MADLRIRKNYYSLTLDERSLFNEALLALKSRGTYDEIVQVHLDAMQNSTPWKGDEGLNGRNSAHQGPAFLPWHRQYLLVMEEALQDVMGDSTFSLPYWNWAEDSKIADPKTTSIWTSEGIGGDGELSFGWVVKNGAFAEWPLINNGGDKPDFLQRQLGLLVPGLPTITAQEETLSIDIYDKEPWDRTRELVTFRNVLEGWSPTTDGSRMHNQVHVWVGGSMLAGTSPNDPAFYLNHCYVDKLWADWQLAQSKGNPDLAANYAPHKSGPTGHNIDDPMFPWHEGDDEEKITPRKMLDHHNLGYQYDTEEVASSDESNAVSTSFGKKSEITMKSPYVGD